ncbi:DUF3017 domain-containing protein [Streptomyces phyllanthi]|uniref:DUF3017 domain-containing protein n=1 Tax=Streptomyces phyllanthi TaxID=1803180 RepID=UPI002AD50098|nr:DUF3017 domain-containing protein [Streptomyces phyllanthi]
MGSGDETWGDEARERAASGGEPRGDETREADGTRARDNEAPGRDAPDDTARTRADGSPDAADSPEDTAEQTVRDAISAPDADGEPKRTTRRFPVFTRDTARPEGGGRAASGEAPAPARQWPILAVLAAVGLGLLLTALDVFRYGTILIGAALLGGAVLRWTVPDVGMLAVRSRFTDMVTYGVLGTAIVLLAMMAQPKPWLEIPFLEDTLHFTIK